MLPSPVPVGRTVRRLEWSFLPPRLRDEVERRCGAPVLRADSRRTGYTPGLASVLECADGSRHFVKAASLKAQRAFAESYRTEARQLAALPPDVAAPALRWTVEAQDWVVLGIEHVAARHPVRPWTRADLDAALALLVRTARLLTPPPAGLALDGFAEDMADAPDCWSHVRATRPAMRHLDEAEALARTLPEFSRGDTVVHTDVRDDNLLLADDGRVLLCDWNWPARGAAWLDTVMLLVGPRGDGVDVEEVLAGSELLRGVPGEHVDGLLALLTGYFLRHADLPVPSSSPYLRALQQWQGEVCWDWLCERRGWE